jgi:hypothetical protein
MCIHGLDPDWFRLSEPEVVAQLQAICRTCKLHERCAADLARKSFVPSRAGRRDYCLNADLLDIYSALASLYWRQDPENNVIRKDALTARRRWKSAIMRLAGTSAAADRVSASAVSAKASRV